eukprot:jgi/Mesvir1/27475/Mv07250-RA.1
MPSKHSSSFPLLDGATMDNGVTDSTPGAAHLHAAITHRTSPLAGQPPTTPPAGTVTDNATTNDPSRHVSTWSPDPVATTAPTPATHQLTLEDVMGMQDVSASIMACLPLIDRARVWLLFPKWRAAIEASLSAQKVLNDATFGCDKDQRMRLRALQRLLPGCPRLDTLDMSNLETLEGAADAALKVASACCCGLQKVSANAAVSDAGVVALARACKGLRELRLSGCVRVTDTSLMIMARACPQLELLEVADCPQVSDTGIEAIAAGCILLGHLDLKGTKAGDAGMLAIATNCPHLHQLNVKDTSVGDAGMQAIATNCTQLTHIYLKGTNVGDAGMQAAAAYCTQLSHVNLKGTSIGDASMVAIGMHLKNLSYLSVQGCARVSSAGVMSVAHGCRLLTTFLLPNQVTDEGLQAVLRSCVRLTSLVLDDFACSDAAFEDLGDGCKELTRLEVNWQPSNVFTERVLLALAGSCHKLTDVTIRNRTVGTDAGVMAILDSSPGLEKLELRDLTVKDVVLDRLSQQCPLVTQLCVMICFNITDRGLARAVARLTKLEVLAGWASIGNRTLFVLGEHCPNLAHLVIESMPNRRRSPCDINDEGVAAVLRGCPRLCWLKLCECAGVNGDAFDGVGPLSLKALVLLHGNNFTTNGLVAMALSCPKLTSFTAYGCHHVTNDVARAFALCCDTLESVAIEGCSVTGACVLDIISSAQMLVKIETDCRVSKDDSEKIKLQGFKPTSQVGSFSR